jgi:hypothetical protein
VIYPASTRTFWEARTTALARRVNFGAWLTRLAPAVFFVASAFAVALYAVRRVQTPLTLPWLAFGVAVALTAAMCWWRARPFFFRRTDARVLLESHLRLDTRLTAAELGLVEWPAVPDTLPSVLRWRLQAPTAWLGASLALILAAVFSPVPRDANATRPSGPPPSLVQAENMLAAVKEMNVADPPAVQQLENRARELARRPADEQYSHSALEAADALREQTAMSLSGLANSLEAASNAMRSADSDMNSATGSLASALSGLRDGGLPLNKDLLSALGSAADLKNLSAAQRAQLAQQMGNLSKGLKGVAGANGAGAEVAAPDPDSEGTTVAAGGGPGGGGEAAPLMFNLNASNAGDGEMQGLSAEALKRFALGDKLGMSSGAHDIDPTKAAGPTSAGAAATPASGGEAVWVNRLTPAERAALKKFFK